MLLKHFRRFAKRQLSLLIACLLISNTILSEGFLAGTLIKTPNAYKPIEQLKENDLVTSYSFQNKNLVEGKIIKIKKVNYKTCIKLTIEGEDLLTAPDHKFYCPLNEKNHWVKAKELKSGDFILSDLTQCVRIDNVVEIAQECDFYCLSIDKYQNFFISEKNIFVHNFFAIFGFTWVIGEGIKFTIGAIGAILAGIGIVNRLKDKDKNFFNDNHQHNNHNNNNSNNDDPNKKRKKEDGLPIDRGDFPFHPKKNKEDKIPKDKEGRFIDKKGNKWSWDPRKSEWDVVDKRGKGHRNVNIHGEQTHRGTHPDSKSNTSKSRR